MKRRAETISTKSTAADVAALAGVHRSSVSAVLNGARTNTIVSGDTRQRILKAAAELGYVADPHAQLLAGGRNRKMLALLMPEMDFDMETRKAKAIQAAFSSLGFHVPLYVLEKYAGFDHATFVKGLRLQRPGAIICNTWGLHENAIPELEQYQAEGGILICFNYLSPLKCDQVIFDREDSTYQAARHLLEEGHRDIGLWMAGSLKGERIAGFRRALAEFQVQERPEWIINSGHYTSNERSGADLAAVLLAMPKRPTAMCIVNDYTANVCIAQLMRAGVQVPSDISVICHDDLPIAEFGIVALTSLSQPIQEITENIVTLLRERIEARYTGEPRTVTIRGTLHRRESVCPPHFSVLLQATDSAF